MLLEKSFEFLIASPFQFLG